MKHAWILILFGLAGQALAKAPDTEECEGKISNLEMAQCFDLLKQKREAEIEKLYQAALAKMPEKADDSRSSVKQFIKEHSAWKQYAHEHCAFFAGLMEGKSSWIDTSELRCDLRELDARIAFLSDLPWNPEKAR